MRTSSSGWLCWSLGLAAAGCSAAATVEVNGTAYERVAFEDLAGWQYVDGLQGIPDRVRALSGRRIAMVGAMLPIDLTYPARVTQAMLVRSLGAFERGENELNHVVCVVMPDGFPGELVLCDRVEVTGRFEVRATVMDGFMYRLHADRVEPLR